MTIWCIILWVSNKVVADLLCSAGGELWDVLRDEAYALAFDHFVKIAKATHGGLSQLACLLSCLLLLWFS